MDMKIKNKKKLLINYQNKLKKQKLLKKKKQIKIKLADYIIIDMKLFDIQQMNLNIFIELKNLKVIKNKGKQWKKILNKSFGSLYLLNSSFI